MPPEQVKGIHVLKYIGHAYFLKGEYQKANFYLDREIKTNLEKITNNHRHATVFNSALNLACIYSARGEIEKSLEYLVQLKNKTTCWETFLLSLHSCPMYDNIRSTQEFKEVINHLESVYQYEHEQVKQLLAQS